MIGVFPLDFLAGHPSYYPRHGYRACFGWAHIKVDVEKLPAPEIELDADWSEAVCELSDAAMAHELREGVLDAYLQAVEQGRPVGTPNWPLPFLAH
jgi:hypothetical protein